MNTTLVIVIILLALLLVAWLPIAIRTLRRAFHSDPHSGPDPEPHSGLDEDRHSGLDPESQTDNNQ